MNKLKNKTFITIFSILSSFLIILLLIFNIQNYNREYNNIKNNLFRMINEKVRPNNEPRKIIMDYDIYTVVIDNNKIDSIFYNSNNESDINNISNIANNIINSNRTNKIHIGNLYLNKYAYNYHVNSSIIIIDTSSINEKLNSDLLISFLILILTELLIYLLSKKITEWITKPALDSYNKQKDFIADASHELKTPLAVIMASSDELKVTKSNIKYLDNIKRESERMNKLITSLLDLSKLENNNKEMFREFNLSKVIEKACLTFESIAYENNLEIESNVAKDIKYLGIEDEIYEVMCILIDNAIKHSNKDTKIKVNLIDDKKDYVIHVINTGDEIEKGEEEKIFERFYRSDKGRNRDANRYGLGLAIAKNIVNNHNGIIKAKSSNGETIFEVILKK